MRYDRFDPTGEASTPGSYAFLMPDGDAMSVVETYEELRTASTVMRVHTVDAVGVSHAAFYDAVEAGDLFEWRESDDCFVRYAVTEVMSDPTGAVPRKLLAVEWMTYSYGRGCSGSVATDTTAITAWGDLPNIRSSDVTSFVRHGPYLTSPSDWRSWASVREPSTVHWPPGASGSGEIPVARLGVGTRDLAEARRLLPYWSDPVLPEGWTFRYAESGTDSSPTIGHCATYSHDGEYLGVEVCIRYKERRPQYQPATRGGSLVWETLVVDGRAALVRYSPQGPVHDPNRSIIVLVFDAETGIEYQVWGYMSALRGSDPAAAIAIARSLLPDPREPSSPVLRYDRFDPTGEASKPGSYAFLMPDGDTTRVVETYEELRTESTVMRVHTVDADGVSHAAVYDGVGVGDLFEWRESDDCFVRYQVTEVMPDPSGTVPRKLLAVEWMTYAFTGCSGAVNASAVVSVKLGPLPHLGGTDITAPVVHGVYQIVPVGWTGATKASVRSERSTSYPPEVGTADITVARTMRYWRDPAVPEGWVFYGAAGGGDELQPVDGYCASWVAATGGRGFKVCGKKGHRIWFGVGEGSWHGGNSVFETRVVAGRPASVIYSTTDPFFPLQMRVYDPATDVEYTIWGYDQSVRGGQVDAVIAIAEGMFAEQPPTLPAVPALGQSRVTGARP